jgi:hypothetical protein
LHATVSQKHPFFEKRRFEYLEFATELEEVVSVWRQSCPYRDDAYWREAAVRQSSDVSKPEISQG